MCLCPQRQRRRQVRKRNCLLQELAKQAAEKLLDEGHGFSRAENVVRARSALAAEVRFSRWPGRELIVRNLTSGAEALNCAVLYGTAKAVPFVQDFFGNLL
jgi:hypothetical protein